jgi:cell division protein FtsZ
LESIYEKSIEDIAKESIPTIKVLGVGGAGCNIVSWMKEKGVLGASILALNSDAQHLSITKADKRMLIGYGVTSGLGCGGFPEKGAKSAEENLAEIEKEISGSGLAFIASGLGGGTGTGASPVIARLAKKTGALTLGVVTIPFQVERARLRKAREGLKRLRDSCDAVIVIDNNRLRRVAGTLPLQSAFAVANKLIATFIKNVSETIAIPSLMNLDFADMKAIMMGGGVCAIGFGEGTGDTKVETAVEKALENQLLDIGNIKESEGALVHITGGDDMTLEDVNKAGELVIDKISPNARVSWGARVNGKMEGGMSTTVVLAGVDSPFLIEQLPAFGALKPDTGRGMEVEIVEKPLQEEKQHGFFRRVFG